MGKTLNVAFVGVGGQGIVLASNVIARAAMLAGLDVKQSEVHGMAQRGGSVISQVRIGAKVYSPLIAEGAADYLICFEMLEALRYADMLAPTGTALINRQVIVPVTVSCGQQAWVSDMDERLARAFPARHLIPGLDLARELGNARAVNMVMAGALSCLLDLDQAIWEQAITELVPARFRDLNLSAFRTGREAIAVTA